MTMQLLMATMQYVCVWYSLHMPRLKNEIADTL